MTEYDKIVTEWKIKTGLGVSAAGLATVSRFVLAERLAQMSLDHNTRAVGEHALMSFAAVTIASFLYDICLVVDPESPSSAFVSMVTGATYMLLSVGWEALESSVLGRSLQAEQLCADLVGVTAGILVLGVMRYFSGRRQQ